LNAYDTAIILNQQSMDKFEETVKPGGILLYDPNGISKHPTRKDINIYQIEGAAEAARLKSGKTFNMVILGGYLKIKPIVEYDNVIKGLKKSLPERYHSMIPMNETAIKSGMNIVKEIQTV
jgi:2-oxoglutarate ferredoxin oxidoreductase subunit gamma